MRIVHSLEFILTVILNTIASSSQFECLPNGAPIAGVPRDGASSSSTPSVEASTPVRSRSSSASSVGPPTRLHASDGTVYGIDQIQLIRFISKKNPNRHFELWRYTFPGNKRLKVLEGRCVYAPIPLREQIVLATHDGDVFAILTSNDSLAGIYRHNPDARRKGRVGVNIETGTIKPLTSIEVEECPVGPLRRMLNDFEVVHMDHNDGVPETSPGARPSSSFSTSISGPGMFTLPEERGHGLDRLPSILLTSNRNPNRVFEIRKYTFPPSKKLLLLGGHNHYLPMPDQEHIVLSTLAGEVFAILENAEFLAGIYAYVHPTGYNLRVKINSETGVISALSTDETREIPVGRLRPISNHFRMKHGKHNHLRNYFSSKD